MRHIVLFSGGVGSWAAAKRVAQRHGTDNLTLLFTDTKTEDEDLYRFLPEAAENVGGELLWLAEGRDIWQVFEDRKMMGSTRVDPCSEVLKRKFTQKWVRTNCDPESTTVYVGIDWSEHHRFTRLGRWWHPYRIEAPMTESPYLTKQDVLDWLKREGLRPPRLYDLGFKHNNCGGFCVKMGHGQAAHLLRTLPERFAYHERKEREFNERRSKEGKPPVSILRDWRKGSSGRLTLEALRERVETQQPIDELDWGSCACVEPSEEEMTTATSRTPDE